MGKAWGPFSPPVQKRNMASRVSRSRNCGARHAWGERRKRRLQGDQLLLDPPFHPR